MVSTSNTYVWSDTRTIKAYRGGFYLLEKHGIVKTKTFWWMKNNPLFLGKMTNNWTGKISSFRNLRKFDLK